MFWGLLEETLGVSVPPNGLMWQDEQKNAEVSRAKDSAVIGRDFAPNGGGERRRKKTSGLGNTFASGDVL
jgi:hypothetical protein